MTNPSRPQPRAEETETIVSDEPKRLYEVEVAVKVYVLADDAPEADEIATEAITSGDVELSDGDMDTFEITDARHIAKKWRDSIPFGGTFNCLTHFEERERYERERPRTQEELEAAGQQTLLP
jgi:hypothetical protein